MVLLVVVLVTIAALIWRAVAWSRMPEWEREIYRQHNYRGGKKHAYWKIRRARREH